MRPALLLLLAAAAHAAPLDDVLRPLRLSSPELSIRADLAADPLRLEGTVRLLEDPTSAPEVARATAESLLALGAPGAVRELARRLELAPSSAPAAGAPWRLARGAVPAGLAGALAPLWEALGRARAEVDAALSGLDPGLRRELEGWLGSQLAERPADPRRLRPGETWQERESALLAAAAGFPLSRVLEASAALTEALEAAAAALAAAPRSAWPPEKVLLRTPEGRILIGSPGPDVFDQEADLVLDPGGDDVYRPAALAAEPGAVRVVADLGGDDRYSGSGFGSAGAGVLGIGILYDLAGDDVYAAGDASLGAGALGAGLLVDKAGDDLYRGGRFTQGAGAFGVGLLIDEQGADLYRAAFLGQGAGWAKGAGLLRDGRGNDVYAAGFSEPDPRGALEDYGRHRQGEVFQSLSQGFATGSRDWAAGGLGFLLDGAGNDRYEADYFAQGAGYWLGWGLLYDRSGNDAYQARRYAQGAGIHFAAGTLLDASGNDRYLSWALSQGAGHDFALGLLADGSGDDVYVADWSVMGLSNASGVGVLRDADGSDRYSYLEPNGAVAYWDEKRHRAGTGLLLDTGAGTDLFSAKRDSATWHASPWSAGSFGAPELAWGRLPEPAAEAGLEAVYEAAVRRDREFLSARLKRSQELGGRTRVWELLEAASGWGIDVETPLEAKRALLALPPSSVLPLLPELLTAKTGFARLALEEYLFTAREEASAELARLAGAGDEKIRARTLYYLGQLRAEASVPAVSKALADPSWRVRAAAARALGLILSERPTEDKAELLWKIALSSPPREAWGALAMGLSQDRPTEEVAKAAAALLAVRPPKAPAPAAADPGALERAAKDAHPEVRLWAVRSLGLSGGKPETLIEALSDADYGVREEAARELSERPQARAAVLRGPLLSPEGRTRALALRALSGVKDESLRKTFARALEDPDPAVRLAAGQGLAEGVRLGLWKAPR